MSPFLVRARLELRQMLRARMLVIAAALLLVAGVAAIVDGAARVAAEREVIAALEPALREEERYLRKTHARNDDLGLVLYYLAMPIAREPNGWTALSAGLRDVHPSSRHLRFTGLVPQLYQADIANPLKQLAGNFDYGFVLVFLVPLFIIGVSYDVRSRDEDLGTEPLVCSQPSRLSRLLALRLALRAALVGAVALALSAFAVAWLGLPLDARAGAFALASLAYIALWFVLVFLVASLRRSSAWNAVALAGIWIGWCVLLPALVNVALVTGAPARGGVELTLAQREEMNAGWDRPKRATLEPFFARRPELPGAAVPEDRFSWPWYYAMHEMADARVAPEIEAYHAALARRERWTARAALALPPLALQLVLDRLAGTDMASELAFKDSIAAYHERLKHYFYPLVFDHEGLSALALDAAPRHRFHGFERPVHFTALAGLFGVLALLGAALPLAARRIDAAPRAEEALAALPWPDAPRWRAERARLLSDGYVVIPGVLGPSDVRRFRALARRILAPQASEEYREKHVSIGSLLDILRDPESIDLIDHPRALLALRRLGFDDPRYEHGIVFNKLPRTPRTFWHQDGTAWDHPSAYAPDPQELILIYYLVDTTPHNGCLRVIPGSHRKRHRLHDHLRGSYTPDLRRMRDPSSPAFQSFDDEVPLPVAAGDLVIIDARVLHAAHANDSDEDRTALSLWYVADYRALPERVRARFTLRTGVDERLPYVPAGWPEEAASRLRRMLPPAYEGSADPLPMNSTPDERLR